MKVLSLLFVISYLGLGVPAVAAGFLAIGCATFM